MNPRKSKLIKLQHLLNLETGQIDPKAFPYENALYNRSVRKKHLDRHIRACRLCEGMNIPAVTASCPGWGDLCAKIFVVGQSLHEPGVQSGVPFIFGIGYGLDAALRLSVLTRLEAFITNIVHCHPPRNRASTDEEKENCLPFLAEELKIVRPKLVVALGNDARQGLEQVYSNLQNNNSPAKTVFLKHPAAFLHSGSPEQAIDWVIRLSIIFDKELQ